MNIHYFSSFFQPRNAIYKYLLLLLFFCASTLLFAVDNRQIGNILIIIPNNTDPYQTIVKSIKQRLVIKNRRERVSIFNLSARTSSKNRLKGNRLIITLGAKSLDYYLKSGLRTPFISTFITEGAFTTLTINNPRRNITAKSYVGGISLEQPPYRIISLLKLIQNDIKSIGVILGPNTQNKWPYLRRQVQRQVGGVLNVANIRYRDNPVKKLRTIFKKSQIVLVIPDKASFNRNLAHWVVTLSYKHKVPVVSYSKKYTEAGALISIYTEPGQIGLQTANLIVSYLNTPKISPLKLNPPSYFQIAINRSVSQAFGLKLPSEKTLLRKLYKAEP